MADKFLVADIGGTNTRVGLATENGLLPEGTRRYRNASVDSFEAVLKAYLDEVAPGALRGVCVGAAGPARDGVIELTNLKWRIDRRVVRDVTGAEIADVINDLAAQGLALDDLERGAVKVIKDGEVAEGSRLVVGLGTGFNIVPVHRFGDVLITPACEAGHVTLPYTADQAALCAWLAKERDYPSVELALAGQGIENIYAFHSGTAKSAANVVAGYHAGEDHAVATMRDYAALFGALVGDYGVAHLPFGGIYLTGGVARSVAPILSELNFEVQMRDKGRFSDLAGSFQVSLIEDDFAALKGCARHLKQIISHQ